MRIVKRLGVSALAAVVMSAMLVSPASAQQRKETVREVVTQQEAFAGNALARALALSVLNLNLTVGSSGIEVNSTPRAVANAAGVALIPGTTSSAIVDAVDQEKSPAKACLVDLPLSIVNIELACGETKVSTKGGPQAFGRGTVAGVDIGGGQLLQLLQPVLALLEPVLDVVLGVVQPVLGGLQLPIVGELVGLDEEDPVSSLVDKLTKATSLVSIKLGNAVSQGATNAEAVVTGANAQGAQIDVLPGLGGVVGGPALLSIVVGSAAATAAFSRTGAKAGESNATFDAAIATVKLGLPILGAGVLEIPIKLGQPIKLLEGTPLESEIALGAGTTVKNPDGSVAAVADGVKIHLLKGISGGVKLELAHAEAAIGGKARVVTQQKVVEQLPQLAKTGNDPWLPVAGATLLLAAYMTRRFVVRPAVRRERVQG
jgi:hypothetical protein